MNTKENNREVFNPIAEDKKMKAEFAPALRLVQFFNAMRLTADDFNERTRQTKNECLRVFTNKDSIAVSINSMYAPNLIWIFKEKNHISVCRDMTLGRGSDPFDELGTYNYGDITAITESVFDNIVEGVRIYRSGNVIEEKLGLLQKHKNTILDHVLLDEPLPQEIMHECDKIQEDFQAKFRIKDTPNWWNLKRYL